MTIFAFDVFRFESGPGRLYQEEQEIKLRPQTALVLDLLLQNPGRLIAKDELVREVWGETFVNDQAIFQCINQLRKALGESASNPRFLKTVPRRGYQWIYEDVTETTDTTTEETPEPEPLQQAVTAPQPIQPTKTKRRPAWWLAAPVLAVILVFWFTSRDEPIEPATVETGRSRFALLPFQNATGKSELQWVELGLMDMVVRALSNDPKVGPVPTKRVLDALEECGILRGSVLDGQKSVRLLEVLGTRWVVDVTISAEGENFVLRYRALAQEGDAHERQILGDSLTEMAQRMAAELGQFFQADSGLPIHAFSKDSFVNESYALGVQELSNGFEAKARPYFEICLQKDPDFLWAGLQLTYCDIFQGNDVAATEKAIIYGEKAELSGDRALAAEFASMQGNLTFNRGNFKNSLLFFEKASKLYRELGDVEGQIISLIDEGMVRTELGEGDKALPLYKQALDKTLAQNDDHALAAIYGLLSDAYAQQGSHEEALGFLKQQFALSVKLDQRETAAYAQLQIGEDHLYNHRLAEARQSFETALEWARKSEHKPVIAQALVDLGELAIEQDRFDEARPMLHEALSLAKEMENPLEEVQAQLSTAKLGAWMKDEDLALGAGTRAIELAQQLKDEAMEVEAWSHLGDYYFNINDLEAGKLYLDKVWAYHQEHPNPISVLLMARYLYETGKAKEAVKQQARVKEQWPDIWDRREEALLNRYQSAAVD